MIDKVIAAKVRATLRRIVSGQIKQINHSDTVTQIMAHWPEGGDDTRAYVETCLDLLESQLLAQVHNFIN